MVKGSVIALAVIALAIQVVRPARTNPPVEVSRTIYARMQVPAEARAILERSCRDCHSNETRWPWYSNVAPVSWFVIDHVNHGRSHMNFSEWADYDRKQQLSLLQNMHGQIKGDEMPLQSYLLMHAGAKLSRNDRETLMSWALEENLRGRVARMRGD